MGKFISRAFAFISDALYTFACVALLFISFAMITYASLEVWTAFTRQSDVVPATLDAVGFIVISIAIFDVGKYLMEEEVLRDRELRSASEARRTLTKFMTIITIAVALEALVFIFSAGKQDVNKLLYPTLLLLSAVVVMVGLGLYQRLSMQVEVDVKKVAVRKPNDIISGVSDIAE